MIYALNQDNKKIHILDADKRESYTCENCDDEVTPRQGEMMPWHFAHFTIPDCIIEDRKGKGCILRILDNQDRRCKAVEECEQECPFKNG